MYSVLLNWTKYIFQEFKLGTSVELGANSASTKFYTHDIEDTTTKFDSVCDLYTYEIREHYVIFKEDYAEKIWYLNGFPHREGDKPAVISADGSMEWWVNGQRHRDGGNPAVIRNDGSMEWWDNGTFLTKEPY